jgi:hypothetical protein
MNILMLSSLVAVLICGGMLFIGTFLVSLAAFFDSLNFYRREDGLRGLGCIAGNLFAAVGSAAIVGLLVGLLATVADR